MIGFGIVGCGSASPPVARAIAASSMAELIGVFDVNEQLSSDLAARHAVKKFSSFPELLENEQVEAVYIAVPHDLLQSLACQALRAGKHVLVEKPMAITLEQADEVIALAETEKRALGVYYEMRWVEPFQQARKLIQGGAIGKVIGLRIQTLIDKSLQYWQSGYDGRSTSTWRGQRSRAGGGVLLMNTSHLLDAVRFITGLEVEQVTGVHATLVAPVEVEDIAAATLVFDNRAVGSVFAGAHISGSRTGDECVEIFGENGQVKLPDPYGEDPLRIFLHHAWGDYRPGEWHSVLRKPVDVHLSEVENFITSIEMGEPPSPSGREAVQVLATVLAIYYAAEKQCSVKTNEVRMIESSLKQIKT